MKIIGRQVDITYLVIIGARVTSPRSENRTAKVLKYNDITFA